MQILTMSQAVSRDGYAHVKWHMDRKQKLVGSIVLRIPNAKFIYDFYLSRVDLLSCEGNNILLCHFAKSSF